MTDDNVTELPVKFKQREGEDRFLVVRHSPCCHLGPYLVDEKNEMVECGKCGEFISPMWVLRQLANKETAWHRTSARYRDEMKRLDERARTKCQHCGKMTRISRR